MSIEEKFENLQRSYDVLTTQKTKLLEDNTIKDRAITRLTKKYDKVKSYLLVGNFAAALVEVRKIEDET